jgi:hypothetical protein
LIRASLDDFLYIHPATPTVEVAAAPSVPSAPTRGHRRRHVAQSATGSTSAASNDLYPLSSGVRDQSLALSPDVPFPIELPSVQTGPAIADDFHAYRIGDEQHHLHFGYRIDWSAGPEGEYYGIEGMNWANPPLFANPSAVRSIDGRSYMFVNDGAHIHDIGWRQHGILYWVSNTLNETLTDPQLLALARSAQEIAR